MNYQGFAAFIALGALLVASSILTIASLSMANMLSSEAYARDERGRLVHKSDRMQELRLKLLNFPRKMLSTYAVCASLITLALAVYILIIVESADNLFFGSISLSHESKKWIIEKSEKLVLPLSIVYYSGYAILIVGKTLSMAKIHFENKIQ